VSPPIGGFIFIGMKKNILIIVGVLFFLLLLFVVISNLKGEEKPFNQIDLSYRNAINNFENPSYYDTILQVGMDNMGMEGVIVNVMKLSDGAKGQFDGELKAHVRYVGEHFYLFIDEMDREEAISVISHEIIHMEQYLSGDLVYDNNNVIWLGQEISLESGEYEDRPWERDAFERESDLANNITKILW
jgi:hypothetical protein